MSILKPETCRIRIGSANHFNREFDEIFEDIREK
jgi:hypothetical protein